MTVLFEAWPAPGERSRHLDLAAALGPGLDQIDGFLSIERFGSLAEPGKVLSLPFVATRPRSPLGAGRDSREDLLDQEWRDAYEKVIAGLEGVIAWEKPPR
jgi:hypothetical protein